MWLWFKTNGTILRGFRYATHFRTYLSGDWDVHWGYDLGFDVDDPATGTRSFPTYRISKKIESQQSGRMLNKIPYCGWLRNPFAARMFGDRM